MAQNNAQDSPDIDNILATIRQVESSNRYDAKARGSSASGAYQFIDDTWNRYTKKSGIGTEYPSARLAPPEVQDEVARFKVQDILKQVGGDVSKVPMVWYTGNPQGRITEEAVKANQGLTPDKYQQKWMQAYTQRQEPRTSVQATAPTAPGPMAQQEAVSPAPTRRFQIATPDALPQNYRVALATSYLGDTETDPVAEKALEIINDMQSGGGSGAFQKKMMSLLMPREDKGGNLSAFTLLEKAQEEEKPKRVVPRMPVRFSKGGEAESTQMREPDMSVDERDETRKKSEEMLFNLRANAGPFMAQFVPGINRSVDVRASAPVGPIRPFVDIDPSGADVTQIGATYGNMGPQGGYEVGVSQRAPVDTPQGKMRMPITAQGAYRMPVGKMGEITAQGSYVPRQNDMPRAQYNANIMYRQRFADGGEVDYNQAAEQMAAGAVPTEGQIPAGQAFKNVGRDLVRGAQYLPYDLVGMPVDLATMAMRPFGYNVEKPFMGSEYLIDKAVQAGIANRPTGSAPETAARIGMGFVNPAMVARQAGRGIEAVTDVVKAPIDRARIQAAAAKVPEEGAYAPLRDRLESQGILALAVKPGGGVVDASETLWLMKGANANIAREAYEARTASKIKGWESPEFKNSYEGQQFQEIGKWIDSKAKPYFEKQYGSPNDPLYKAFEEGTYMPTIFGKAERNNALARITDQDLEDIATARDMLRSDDPRQVKSAREALSNLYDEATPVEIQYGTITLQNRLLNPRYRGDITQYLREEKRLGPEELSDFQMDSILDNFAKTGNLPKNAPFTVKDIEQVSVWNMLDSLATKIDIQRGKYGSSLEKAFKFEEIYPRPYPSSDLIDQEIRLGEPTFKVTDDPTQTLFDRHSLISYMLRTPAEKWKDTSFPELLVRIENDYSKITDPIEIYKRIDNYKPVTTEQRLIGTKGFMPIKSDYLGKGAGWREIVDEGGMLIEGRLLKHCLSEDPKYVSFLKNDMSKFFSLRDNKGKAYATIQIDRLGTNGPFANVHQIKGFRNDEVGDEYGKEIMDFLNSYQKTIDIPLRYTEAPSFLPKEVRELSTYGNVRGWNKGGIVDKPLYDRAA